MSPKHSMAYEALCALNRNAIQISIYLTYCSYSENNNSRPLSHRQKHLYLGILLEDNLNDELDLK